MLEKLIVFVEEPSMESALESILPKLLGEIEYQIIGDWQAVCSAYPRVSASVPQKSGFRDPDAIVGGTWEAFERILKRHGYFDSGLRKVELARSVAAHMDPERNRSQSFQAFRSAVKDAQV